MNFIRKIGVMALIGHSCLTLQAAGIVQPRWGILVPQTNIAANANFMAPTGSVASLNVTGTTNNAVAPFQGNGVTLWACAVATNATISNIVMTVDYSWDGTNYTTSATSWNVVLNGTNPVVGKLVLPYSTLGDVRAVRLTSATNTWGSGTVTFGPVFWSAAP